MIKQLLIAAVCLLGWNATAQDSCSVAALFTYTIEDGTINFTNTSTDEPVDPLYTWTIAGLTSTDENPSFSTVGFDEYETVCFTVYDSLWECHDSLCTSIFFEMDSSDCEVTASFTSSVVDGVLYLTNTSTGEPADPLYDWSVDGLTSSAENPTFSTAEFEESELVCLTVYDSLTDCTDSICMTLYFDADSAACEIVASFTYTIIDDFIYFTNTSSGEPVDVEYAWYFEGAPLPGTSTEENPILSTAGLPEYMSVTFTVHNPSYSCTNSYGETITTSDCGITASFEYETVGDDVILTSTTSGAGIGASYDWFFNETGYSGESVTVPASDFFGDETICLTVSDSLCVDTICDIINFTLDSMECGVIASFTSSVVDGILYLTNTSTGEPMDAMYDWHIDGLSSSAENPTFSTADFEASEVICFTVYDSLWECHDSLCTTLYFDVDSSGCELDVSFTFTVSGGILSATNTSTGESGLSLYSWSIDGLFSGDENPNFPTVDFESSEVLCLTIYDSIADCSDFYCTTIYFDVDSSECDLNANFTASVVDGILYLTNTSTGEPADAMYDWYIAGLSSTEENPTFPIADFGASELVCFTVYDSLWECHDSLCTTLYFDVDSSECELVANFSYEIIGDEVVFTSTSTGLLSEGWYDWYINGGGMSGETVTVPLADFDGEESICLTVSDSFCIDTVCYTFFFGDDSSGVDSVTSVLNYEKVSVSLYPNPATSIITIEISNAEGNNTLIIQNAVGQLIRTEQMSYAYERITLDVTDLPSGLYIITIIDEENPDRIIQEKFVKK